MKQKKYMPVRYFVKYFITNGDTTIKHEPNYENFSYHFTKSLQINIFC